jgi:cobalt-zinc-cadmium efflux system membrane fusion protein
MNESSLTATRMSWPPPARLWWALPVIAAAVAALWFLPHHRPLPTTTAQPYSVQGSAVDIAAQSATRSYIATGVAERDKPLAPEPVPGRVAFDESRAARIVAPLQGRVDTVAVRLGQRVAAGDHLVSIRSSAFVDLLQEIDTLRNSEAARHKTVERLQSLVQLRAAAEKDLLSAELELSEARLAREAAELKLRSRPIESAGSGSYWLNAPHGGVVVERQVLEGEEVGPERSDPLMTIAEIDEVIVTADVPEHDVTQISIGDHAAVRPSAGGEHNLEGTVEYVSEVVDPVRRMVNVRVRVRNEEKLLRPNAFVQVTLHAGNQEPVVVPAEAVVTDDQDSFVFVAEPQHPDRFARRAVVPGRQRGDRIELVSGLEPGETYVTRGALLLLNAVDLAQ